MCRPHLIFDHSWSEAHLDGAAGARSNGTLPVGLVHQHLGGSREEEDDLKPALCGNAESVLGFRVEAHKSETSDPQDLTLAHGYFRALVW